MPIQFTGERVIERITPERIWLDHIMRYEFASRYVKEKITLDIACGTGYGSRILLNRGAAKVTGLDTSIEAIEFANNRYKIDGLEFRIGNILNIDFPENYFDVVVCFETIEHVNNQEKVFSELQRILKLKGLLIVSTPNRRITSPFRSINKPPSNPFHKVEYTLEELTKLLENYFEVLEVYGQRPIKKLFLLPFLERISRRILPMIYDPERGNPKLEKSSPKKEYRYITAICKKIKG